MDNANIVLWPSIISGIGMILVGVGSIWWWKRKTDTLKYYFITGSIAWVISVFIKSLFFVISYQLFVKFAYIFDKPISDLLGYVYGGLLTGVFECGFVWIFILKTKLRNSNWNQSVGFGIGFGAIEAVLVGIAFLIIMPLGILLFPDKIPQKLIPMSLGNEFLDFLSIPAPIVERIVTIIFHAFANMLIIFSVRTSKLRWIFLSMGYKTIIDSYAMWVNASYFFANKIITIEGIWILQAILILPTIVGYIGLKALKRHF